MIVVVGGGGGGGVVRGVGCGGTPCISALHTTSSSCCSSDKHRSSDCGDYKDGYDRAREGEKRDEGGGGGGCWVLRGGGGGLRECVSCQGTWCVNAIKPFLVAINIDGLVHEVEFRGVNEGEFRGVNEGEFRGSFMC